MNTMQKQSPEELATAYAADGYVVVPSLLSAEECAELKEEGLRVLNVHNGSGATVYVGVATISDVYYRLASHPAIVAVLKALMPTGVMFMSDKFVYKSGEARFPTPWHQDIAYWPETRPKISVWIALDDVTAANGALKVLPGSHNAMQSHIPGSERPEGSTPTGEFVLTIGDIPQDAPGEVICEMQRGTALFFSDLLAHASCPNVSGDDRYAIISTYHAPGEDEPFDKAFTARHIISGA